MTNWAKDLASEVLVSEEHTNSTWTALLGALNKAKEEIDGVLAGKSKTKISVTPGVDQITVSSDVGRSFLFRLNRHQRTLSLTPVNSQQVYEFQLTADPDQVLGMQGGLQLTDTTPGKPIPLDRLVRDVFESVIDLKK